jgi:hypothetical protein
MYQQGDAFTLSYKNMNLTAREYLIEGKSGFSISFPDKTPSLVIMRADGPDGKYWMPIPEERETEAAEIGELVLAFLRKK